MHRRRIIHNGVYTHYPPVPYRHYGVNFYPSYQIPEPLPIRDVNIYVPPYYHAYPCRRRISYTDYPYYNYAPRILPRVVLPPPIIHTNVQDDIYYHYDDGDIDYEDEYGNAYRLSRSKVQVVDLVPKNNRMVVSKFKPKEPPPERIIIPRSTVVRHTSLPPYERTKPVRLMPLYHSADPDYFRSHR